MSADTFVVYYGIRYVVRSKDDIDLLERRADPRQLAARKCRLQTHWGRPTDGDDYFLLVGFEIGVFGVENETDAVVSSEEMRGIMAQTKHRLKEGGFDEEPLLICQLEAQY